MTAGGDLAWALGAWDAGPPLRAALQMAQARRRVGYKKGRDMIGDAHLDDFPEAGAAIAAFLVRECVPERIEAAFFLAEDASQQAILSRAV